MLGSSEEAEGEIRHGGERQLPLQEPGRGSRGAANSAGLPTELNEQSFPKPDSNAASLNTSSSIDSPVVCRRRAAMPKRSPSAARLFPSGGSATRPPETFRG